MELRQMPPFRVFEDQTDIPLGQEHEVDPGKLGVPDGSQARDALPSVEPLL
jgi:hypothetical protein